MIFSPQWAVDSKSISIFVLSKDSNFEINFWNPQLSLEKEKYQCRQNKNTYVKTTFQKYSSSEKLNASCKRKGKLKAIFYEIILLFM